MAKGGNHHLNIEAVNIVIAMAGPAESEFEARQKLYDIIYGALSECEYLSANLMDDYMANKIVYGTGSSRGVPYQVTKRRKEIFVDIRSLDVFYRNPPSHWKWWTKIRNNKVDPSGRMGSRR